MEITTYSDFRKNLKQFMDWVRDNRSPVFITRKTEEDMVLLTKSEYLSLQETLYLLSSPVNAKRLLDGIAEYEDDGGKQHDLIEV